MSDSPNESPSLRLSFWLGLIAFVVVLLLPTPADMTPEAKKVAAVAVLMGFWWIGEALPIPCTAMLPLTLFPAMGVMSSKQVAPNYGNHHIFLFMGGLFMAMAMQKWGLDRRMALKIVSFSGQRPRALVLGFMAATGFISMWISDTATVMMMMPIGVAIIMHFGQHQALEENQLADFASSLMLGIAYAGVIGGIGTLIGTPPNLVFAGTVAELVPEYGEVSFVKWMIVGTSVTAVLLPLSWIYLTRIAFKLPAGEVESGEDMIASQLAELGPHEKG